MSELMKFWPLAVVAVGAIASASVDTFRLSLHAEELVDLAEGIDEVEEDVEAIQRVLIERQGTQRLNILRIETEQKAQGEDLDEILLLLQRITNQ